ncbi:MAG: exodeoxyribonuclease V subunit gamma, partial [Ferruginibacter sp.]
SIREKHSVFLKRYKNVSLDEVTIGNSLLTSWGKIIKDTYHLLFRNEDVINNYSDVGEKEPQTDTLLHKIQNDIFYNSHGINSNIGSSQIKIESEELKDGSITINSCFTIAREVEVLYNYLVHLVDVKNENLSARDIVVMVSDIDSYAPYIKAVFENSRYKFRFTIADETFNSGDNLMNALASLLSFKSDDFKGENVMSLLEYSFLRSKFSINNLSLIRVVLDKANIRFGINGSVSDDTVYLSWKYGIQKLIYSISMVGNEEYNFDELGYFLIDVVEGEDANEIIRFLYFVNQLIDYVEERNNIRTLSQWVKYTEETIENFLWQTSDSVTEEYDILMKLLEGFNSVQKFVEEPVKYEVFSRMFIKHLSSETRNSAFANGGITFCSLIPMRSIPFKVVALLGLNFDKFPRKDTDLSFNLIKNEARRGDRSTKDNDKHLFLETLLSAKNYLYISYIGQNVADNTVFPPSILLDELVDYIDSAIEKDKNKSISAQSMITRHPLHSFSSKYGNETEFYNYLQLNPENEIDIFGRQREEKIIDNNINIENFLSFFKNPFKYYYNNVLDIRYSNDDELLPETEVFALDALEEWKLKNVLLKRFENSKEEIENEWMKKGLLPLKNSGKISYSELIEKVAPVWETLSVITHEKKEEIIIVNVKIDAAIISGNLNDVYENSLVSVCFSKELRAKHYLDAYLKYLIGSASGKIKELILINCNGVAYKVSGIEQHEAVERLSEILKIYFNGQKDLVSFSADWFKTDVISDLNYESFFKGIDKIVNNYIREPDKFLKMEYEAGFFDDEKSFIDFLNYSKILLLPFAVLFEEMDVKIERL